MENVNAVKKLLELMDGMNLSDRDLVAVTFLASFGIALNRTSQDDFCEIMNFVESKYGIVTDVNDATWVLFELSRLLLATDLYSHLLRFLFYVRPNVVADWAGLARLYPGKKSTMLILLYQFFELMSRQDANVLSVDLENVYSLLSDLCDKFWIEEDKAKAAIGCVCYYSLRPELDCPDAIEYGLQKYGLAYGTDGPHHLWEDTAKQYLGEDIAYLPEERKRIVENLRPADPIVLAKYTLFPANDSSIDVMLVNEFLALRGPGRACICNPSPWVLEIVECMEKDKNNDIFLIVPDSSVRSVCRRRMPSLQILGLEDLEPIFGKASGLLVFAATRDETNVETYLACAAEGCEVTALLPETAFSSSQASLLSKLSERNLYVRALVRIPSGICGSEPRKKMILHATTVPVTTCALHELLATEQIDTMYWAKEKMVIAQSRLGENCTFRQMWNRQLKAERYPLAANRKGPTIFRWSAEIFVHYSIFSRGEYWSGRVFVCNFSFDKNGNIHFGKRLSPRVEKGLRGRDPDDIIDKIEQEAVFFGDLEKRIIEMIVEKYRYCPEQLTLKTLWFCLRSALTEKRRTYREDICRELFCGNDQTLADLVPMLAGGERLAEVLEEKYNGKNQKVYLDQVMLVLGTATEHGYLPVNPLRDAYHARIHRDSKKSEVISRVRARTLSHRQELEIVKYIIEEIDGNRRFVIDPEALFGAFRLFLPLTNLELAELKWSNLVINDDYLLICLEDRFVAASPFLSMLARQRKEWLVYNKYRDDQLPEKYLFSSGAADDAAPINVIRDSCRRLLKMANVEPAKLPLLGEELQTPPTSAIFRDNFRANALSNGLDEGEVSYLCGLTPKTVVDNNYFCFEAAYNLARMAAILRRWTAPYAALLDCEIPPTYSRLRQTACSFSHISSTVADKRSCVEIEIAPQKEGNTQIEVDTEFGHSVEVIIYQEE